MKTLYESILDIDNNMSKATDAAYKAAHPKTKQQLRDTLEQTLEINPNADLNWIDVSTITDMSGLFRGLDPGNIDISKWDVSNVTDMSKLFYCCGDFNSDLSKWNVSKVNHMSNVFGNCKSLKKTPEWYKE